MDIRCTDAEEMVAKARGLVAMYTEVSAAYSVVYNQPLPVLVSLLWFLVV